MTLETAVSGSFSAPVKVKKRALSFNEAKAMGLVHGDYAFSDLPGEFTATLKYKVWGKTQNLNLYFEADSGGKYGLSVFSNRADGADRKYPPKAMPDFDLSSIDIQAGMKFRLVTKVNRNGNTNFLEAHIL